MHALGFHHEHTRADRNNFVTINLGNVQAGRGGNFNLAANSNDLDTTYDFGSVMHYPFMAFSNNMMNTIDFNPASTVPEPFNTFNNLIGQRSGPTNTDILQIQLLYQCNIGFRTFNVANVNANSFCTPDCPCWENAPYECENNSECQAGLVCARRTEMLVARQEPYCANTGINGCALAVLNQPNTICQQRSDQPSSIPSSSPSAQPSASPSLT